MRLDPTMPTKVMARGIGVPLIQVEMVLADGKAERFPGGGQRHHALALAKRTIAPAGTLRLFINLKSDSATMAAAPLNGHIKISLLSLSCHRKTLNNIVTNNPKTELCRCLFY